jgi:mRNA interferase RelE/StbE
MAVYKIFFRRSVLKDLAKIPKSELQRIIKKIEKLAHDPRPKGCEKISGQDRFRIRQGNYRIIYSIQDDELTIWVVKIGHRREIYRKLGKDKSYGKIHE